LSEKIIITINGVSVEMPMWSRVRTETGLGTWAAYEVTKIEIDARKETNVQD
jgi:hypothetical protein